MRIDPNIIRQQVDALIAAYPELAEDETLLADTIEGETDAHHFLSRLVQDELFIKAQADALSETIKAFGEQKARFARQVEARRELMLRIMDACQIRKAPLQEATLSLRDGSPKVVITDEAALPEEFVRWKSEPDKTAIKEALSAGQDVPGAALSNGTPTVSLRVA